MFRSLSTLSQKLTVHKAVSYLFIIFIGLALSAGAADAQSLRGSSASMDRQNRQASAHDFTFLRDGNQVARFVNSGRLVQLRGNRDYLLKDVSYPYARPEVKLFTERLAAQFRAACGEQLVVTSLTRPRTSQPRNASPRSVHPTGMAIDLRRHNKPSCRSWLESVLLSLEERGVLEAAAEKHPPHYHVALFPRPYADYVKKLIERGSSRPNGEFTDIVAYKVSRRDTLWRIAQSHGTTTDHIKSTNGLTSARIYPGQVLQVPLSSRQR
ncbi:MAG TPA: DUF5715 family protein [Acidobacteriota bacterium]|nr:DUF5715 family protein [Acidobacteriota bacterium]